MNARQIASKILSAIQAQKIDPASATSLVLGGMEIVHQFPGISGIDKRQLVIDAIKVIASGFDGITGTTDDLIPPVVMSSLTMLANSTLLGDIIDTLVNACKSTFMQAEKARLFSCCFKN